MSEETYKKMYLMYEDATEENSYLKKRIEYLERSNNRREDTITSLRDELTTTESVLDEIREVINQNMSSYSSCIKAFDEIEQILNKVK